MDYCASVLFIDDEKNILNALRRSLRKEGYNKAFASSSKEAMEVIECFEIAVVVSDIRLPDRSGIELLKEIEEKRPKIIKIALTGVDLMDDVVEIFDQVELYKYFTKPWNIDHLKEAINKAITLYNSKQDQF